MTVYQSNFRHVLLHHWRAPFFLCALLCSPQAAALTIALCHLEHAAVPAGQDYYLATGQRVYLWQGEGEAAAGCSSVELPLPTTALRWMGLVAQETAAPAQVTLQGSFAQSVRVSEVDLNQAAIIAATPPALAGDLLTQQVPLPRQRSAWFWAPVLWQEQAEQLLALAQARQLERLFLTLPASAGLVQQPQQLSEFITRAHALGLQVWPVLGDPRHVLPTEHAALAEQVKAYLDYNAHAADEARLDGLQLDIEPHLLPGFALAQPQWREAWLATVQAVQQQLGTALPLDLVLPVWWGTHPAWGRALLDQLRGGGLSLTIMNYRTAIPALHAGAQPFLEWGQLRQIPVSMALEAGSVGPDEQRLHFIQADSGELLWLTLGEHRVLVLLDAPQRLAGSVAYRLQREDLALMGNLTFAGDMVRLESTAAELEMEWRSWSVYAGLAIHGLDELLLQKTTAPAPAVRNNPAQDTD